jgi:hypothetical protein
VFVVQEAGVGHGDADLKRGLSWLARHQSALEGLWPGSSLNWRRELSSNVGHFMSDAATGNAVRPLTETNQNGSIVTPSQSKQH